MRQAVLACSLIFLGGLWVDEATPLQGTWQVKSATMAGESVAPEIVRSLRLEITGLNYIVTTAAGPDEGKLELDAQASPKRMKIIGVRGPNKDRTILAIYEQSGDELKISYLLRGESYPKDFTSTAENKHFVVVYERKK